MNENTHTVPSRVGIVTHRIFHWFHSDKTKDRMLEAADTFCKKYKFTLEEYATLIQSIENFFEFDWDHLGETLSTEKKLSYKDGSKYRTVILDRIIRTKDNKIIIIDYKTNKKEQSKDKLSNSFQMNRYAKVCSLRSGVPLDDISIALYYPVTNSFIITKPIIS